jgi:hypothetical protein
MVYDCILAVVGHSEYQTNEPSYRPMFPGCSVTTILLANPGLMCFASVNEVKTEVEENFNKTEEEFFEGDGLFGKTPEEILDVFSEALKPGEGEEEHPSTGYKHPTYHADYCKFVGCPGSISKVSHSFFNKVWTFDDKDPKEIGCIMLIIRQPGNGIKIIPILESEIAAGGFTISKADLFIRLFTHTPFRNPLLLDFGCSITSGTPQSIAEFTEKGIYGGKKIECNMSFNKKLEKDLHRVTPEVADLIRQYRASVDAGNPNQELLTQIHDIQTAIDTLLSMKHSVRHDALRKGGRRRTRRR